MSSPQIFDRLLELTVALDADMADGLAVLGLTPQRAHLLLVLREHGPSKQQRLATLLGVTPRAVTALVDAIVGSGFAERRAHPDDRRAFLVTLTDPGQRLADELAEGRVQAAEQLFGALSDADRRKLLELLDATLARFHAARAAASNDAS